jgi:hypothetical protein
MKKQDISIINQEDVSTEVLADAIVSLSENVERLLKGPLNEKALVILIQDAMGGRAVISKDMISSVLHNTAALKDIYVVKGKRKVEL